MFPAFKEPAQSKEVKFRTADRGCVDARTYAYRWTGSPGVEHHYTRTYAKTHSGTRGELRRWVIRLVSPPL